MKISRNLSLTLSIIKSYMQARSRSWSAFLIMKPTSRTIKHLGGQRIHEQFLGLLGYLELNSLKRSFQIDI